MKILIILVLFSIITFNSFSQERDYRLNIFSAKFIKNNLEVFDSTNKMVYDHSFNDPHETIADLDDDGVNELLVSDSHKEGNADFYTLYIYNTIDSFYVADSIQSGFMEPYQTTSNDYKGIIIITGNPQFDFLNNDVDYEYVPIMCWHYDSEKISSINDQVYSVYISENDTLLDVLDSYLESNKDDCNSIKMVKGIIASIYVNYLSAGEKILASQFLKKYYHCDDYEIFKKKLNELL